MRDRHRPTHAAQRLHLDSFLYRTRCRLLDMSARVNRAAQAPIGLIVCRSTPSRLANALELRWRSFDARRLPAGYR